MTTQTFRPAGRRGLAAALLASWATFWGPSSPAHAVYVVLTDTADADARSATSAFTSVTLTTDPSSLVVRQFAASPSDRSIVAFDVSSVPAGATLTAASLSVAVTSVTTNPGQVVDVFGLTTAGPITAADATAATSTATPLGSYNSGSLYAFPPQYATVSLSAAGVQALLGSGTLKLRLQGDTESVNTDISGRAGGFAPQLNLTYTAAAVPEPSSWAQAGLGLALAAGYAGRRRRLGRSA